MPPGPPTAGATDGDAPRGGPGPRRAAVIGGLVGALVAALVAVGMWLVLPRSSDDVITEVRPSATLKGRELDLRALLVKVRPSVVSIKTGIRSVSGDSEAAGSGVVLSGDGLVLTNAHVIEGATAIQVSLSDGSTHPADLVGSFTANDVAIVRARGVSGLTPAELGRSDRLQVGDDVVAIGNALNLGAEPTVTKGIVSALDRSIPATGLELEHLIQTDAAINPGNSGGPLVDATGQVVGINTAIIPDQQNLGFSLAIDQIKPLIKEIEDGKGQINADTPFLGVSTTNIAEQRQDIVDQFHITVDEGAFVTAVVDGSAAGKGGLVAGDVIVGIDDQVVKTKDDVGAIVRRHVAGDQIEIHYVRNGESHTATVQLARRGNN
jgi:S1-C subfamily serine protease